MSTVILAAGVGKRMYSRTPKVLHTILGKHLISFVIEQAQQIGCDDIVVVVGRDGKTIRKIAGPKVTCVLQPQPRGTGDAALKGISRTTHDQILILSGDVPLLRPHTLCSLIAAHKKNKADLTLLSCTMDNPYGYGRLVRTKNQQVAGIVEETDASIKQKKIKEINSGIYFGNKNLIKRALRTITAENVQHELYLTDIVASLLRQKKKVVGFRIADHTEIMGINTQSQLAEAREKVKARWFEDLMQRGVHIEDPSTTTIDLSVDIGRFVRIRPHTLIEGKTKLKNGMTVGPFMWIKDGKVLKRAHNV